MQPIANLVKTLIRPFIIVWGLVVYGVCVIAGIEMPDMLGWLMVVVVGEYFGERAIKRFKEK